MAEVHGPRKLKLSRSVRCCASSPQPGASERLPGARPRGSVSTRGRGALVAAGTLLPSGRSSGQTKEENTMGRGLLLWLIGIPIPIILLIWLFGGLH